MNVFQAAKEANMLEVAQWLGFEVRRIRADRGVMCCPFHHENTPSMYLFAQVGNNHYYCFGCKAHGDPTDLFARTQNIRPIDAAQSICCNYGFHYDQRQCNPPQPVSPGPGMETRILAAAVREWRSDQVRCLMDFHERCHRRIEELIRADAEGTAEFTRLLLSDAEALEEAERWSAMDVPGILIELREAIERYLPPSRRRLEIKGVVS